MGSTNDERDRRRAEKWLTRSGGFLYLPREAFDLLTRRLAASHRARIKCLPLFLLGVLILLSLAFETGSLGSAAWARTFAWRMLATYAVLAVAILLAQSLTSRAERLIGQTLPSRTTRGTAISVRIMLGKTRLAYLVVAIVVQAALAVTLLAVHPDRLAWTFLSAFIVNCGFVALGLRQAATRATIALDQMSLAIDERLRAEEAFSSFGWLSGLLIAFPTGISQGGPAWLHLVWLGALAIIYPGQIAAAASKPWKVEHRRPLLRSAAHADASDPWVKL